MKLKKKPTKKQLAYIRSALYFLSSVALKTAGIRGWIDDKESQTLLLAISAVFDLAFANVSYDEEDSGDADDSVSVETSEELDTSRDTSV